MIEPGPASAVDELAARLLDAQVAFERGQLRGTGFHAMVLDEVDALLAEASEITLAEAVTADMIKAVAAKYAVQVPVEGAIPELVGEIAGRLFRHRANTETRLEDIFDDRSFGELAATIAEMPMTRRAVDQILASEALAELVAAMIARAVGDELTERERAAARGRSGRALRAAATRIGAIRIGGTRLGTATGTRLGHRGEELTRRAARFVLSRAHADAELVNETVNQLWRRHSGTALDAARGLVTDSDVEDVVVLIFEFWRTFRDTPYFRALLDEGIDHVFDKYGDTSLYELLAELGVGREDMIEEALRFGPPVIEVLDERSFLDEILRRRLTPFYASDEFRAAVGGLA